MDENSSLLNELEEQGRQELSNFDLIYKPTKKDDTKTDKIIGLFHNIGSIQSPDAVTGLLLNLSVYIDTNLEVKLFDQIWEDLIVACQFVSNDLDIYAINQILRNLIFLSNLVNPKFLDFLVNSEIPLDKVRPYAIETLYYYLPPKFFTYNDDRKHFLADLFINSFSEGNIYHRSFMIQLLFSLFLSREQILSLEMLPPSFWKLMLDISLEENFFDFITPVNKMKMTCSYFFEQENPMINEALQLLKSNIDANNNYLQMTLNLFKIFPFFPLPNMLQFLDLSFSVFERLSNEEWQNIKSISHVIGDSLSSARFNENEIKHFFAFTSRLPLSSGKYFLSIHFLEFFAKNDDFIHPFINSICQNWTKSENFNPVIFCYCICESVPYLNDEREILNSVIIPSIFSFIEANDPLLNYQALKVLNHLYREDLIKVDSFINTLLELTLKANPFSLKHFFKIIVEIINHISEEDDEYEYEEEEEENTLNTRIRQKLNEFVRTNIFNDDLHPCLRGYLCDTLAYLINTEEPEYIHRVGQVCFNLVSNPATFQFHNIYIHVASLVLQILQKQLNKGNNCLDVFYPTYNHLIQLLHADFTSDTLKENFEQQKIIANIALLCARISKKVNKFQTPNSFAFPVSIIANVLNLNSIEASKFGIDIIRQILFTYYPPKNESENTDFMNLLSRVVDYTGKSTDLVGVNLCYKVFIKLMKNIEDIRPFLTFLEQMKDFTFQERLKMLNGRSFIRVEENTRHFYFFKFIIKLIEKRLFLTPKEIFILIRWIEGASKAILTDLLKALSTVIVSDNVLKDTNIFDPLWKSLSSKLDEVANSNDNNFGYVKSLMKVMLQFLEKNDSNNIMKVNCSSFFLCIQNFWDFNRQKFSELNEEDFDYQKVLGPFYLHLCALSHSILDFNHAILNEIGTKMIEMDYKSWNYPQMIEDILHIYRNHSTFYLFSNTASEVLFIFYHWRNRADSKGNYFLSYLGFSDELINNMKKVLIDMKNKDDRFLNEYLALKYDEKIINDVFNDEWE